MYTDEYKKTIGAGSALPHGAGCFLRPPGRLPSAGVDFLERKLGVDGEDMRLKIWDTVSVRRRGGATRVCVLPPLGLAS